jgi:hypothetical protein
MEKNISMQYELCLHYSTIYTYRNNWTNLSYMTVPDARVLEHTDVLFVA